MPTYEFRCPLGHEFERFYRTINTAEAQTACPECGQMAERMMSAGAGLLFKGSGFYLTDYGKDAHKKKAPAEGQGDGAKGEQPKGESAKGESAKGESAKGESAKGEAASSGSSGDGAAPASGSRGGDAAKRDAKPAESKPAPKPGAGE